MFTIPTRDISLALNVRGHGEYGRGINRLTKKGFEKHRYSEGVACKPGLLQGWILARISRYRKLLNDRLRVSTENIESYVVFSPESVKDLHAELLK